MPPAQPAYAATVLGAVPGRQMFAEPVPLSFTQDEPALQTADEVHDS